MDKYTIFFKPNTVQKIVNLLLTIYYILKFFLLLKSIRLINLYNNILFSKRIFRKNSIINIFFVNI